ncbi:T9SS type A sorting domain-containing protein [Persicitalea sp.]|uniref:T9SS type A sorting domain-containing protein n=1 Tax=Persicitalea sp. TaxID=3100273 RepID=UPI0035937035
MNKIYVLLLFLGLGTEGTYAKIYVSSPQKNTVIQRDQNNRGTLQVGGTLTFPYDKLEARLVPFPANGGEGGTWATLSIQGRQGIFLGSLQAQGGWYQLEIRGFFGGEVAESASVQPVGIGEVFLIAGHSNAMGLPNLGAKDAVEQVVSFNSLNKNLNNENITVAPDEPMPAPNFEPLKAANRIYPSGESAWYWGELGSLLVARLGVPVLFMNAGWAAANSVNWRETANGQNTRNIYVGKDWPNRQPYSNFINTLRYYHSWLGLRSVLWFHGENDAVHLKIAKADYYQNIRRLIEKTNQDFGRVIGWAVALSSVSYNAPDSYLPVIEAQIQLAQTPGLRVWGGPTGDTIQVPRPAHGHFENVRGGTQGLSQMATAWNRSLSDAFFSQIPAYTSSSLLLTGVVPRAASPGQSFLLPYYARDVFTLWMEAQLLDEAGNFLAIVGSGPQNPLRVTLPAALAEGSYRLRVVAQNPTRPGNVSEVFQVKNGLPVPQVVKSIETQTNDGRLDLHALFAAHPDLSQITVERSEDRVNFLSLGDIPLAFDRNSSSLYSFSDGQPLPGSTYYRLRLRDQSGRIHYSPVIAVFSGDSPSALTAFPNPAQVGEPIYLRIDLPLDFDYHLIDTQGKKIPADLTDSGIIGLPILQISPAVPAGIYFLKIETQDTTQVQRIMIR